MAKYTLADFRREFPDDDACLAYLFAKRYGQHGPVCECGKRDSFHIIKGDDARAHDKALLDGRTWIEMPTARSLLKEKP